MCVVLGAKLEPNLVQCYEKTKKLALSIGFFHILYEEYIYKQKVVVIEIPEWTLKANIA